MQTTLTGKGPKCRVCTHPERNQIESLLARGAGISSLSPLMATAFSRRALYRHRANHMIFAPSPAARPVPFPHTGSTLKKLKWLQRETEHAAALAGYKGDLSLKLRALHELAKLLWLEARLSPGARAQGAVDVTELLPEPESVEDPMRIGQESRRAIDLQEVFRRSSSSHRSEIGNDDRDASHDQSV
jgi:hypothetical protein